MLSNYRFVRNVTFAFVCATAWCANGLATVQQPLTASPKQTAAAWLNVIWTPILHFFFPLFQTPPESLPADPLPEWVAAAAPPLQPPVEACPVAPLDPIEDPVAQKLEASVASSIDVDDMTPAAARALDRFESNVAAAGGTVVLKSAYRPAAYQQHLQNVWYKWMRELRKNEDPDCQNLRAQVQDEFARHHLIETQHPVAVSDHTRGLAFDATIDLPIHARLGRRRVTVDNLARLAGLRRPAIAADPVHFKYVGGVGSRSARRTRNA